METNEFIKGAEALGYTVRRNNSVLSVYSMTVGYTVCVLTLETDQRYSLHMRPGNFSCAIEYEEEQEGLYNLAVEYDKTPVEKREKEKRYRVRWELSDVEKQNSYLNRDEEGNIFFSDCNNAQGAQTIFTALEVELMPLWVSHFIVEDFLIQEEVEDDE